MYNLIKMEKYQLLHNLFYWCGIVCVFLLGFFTAETYVQEVMGAPGRAAAFLADIFNGMVYDSTFLLILTSSILALILGQEFSCRTINLEVASGHSRKSIFFSKVITYLIAFNVMILVYPIAGCVREFSRFGISNGENFFYQVVKAALYSLLLNSVTFLIAIWICVSLRSAVKGIAVTAITTFVMSLYLAYGMKLKLPIAFLPTYQIRRVVASADFFHLWGILVGGIWIIMLMFFSWLIFYKCELK